MIRGRALHADAFRRQAKQFDAVLDRVSFRDDIAAFLQGLHRAMKRLLGDAQGLQQARQSALMLANGTLAVRLFAT